MPELAADLILAHELIDQASAVALSYLDKHVDHKTKIDGTPVSAADFLIEDAIVSRLQEVRPGDSILGEERGVWATGERRWIIDPIDGTFNFVSGNPQWGTHIALEIGGIIVLGVVSRPAQKGRWWATSGQGAYKSESNSRTDGVRIHVSTRKRLQDSRVTVWGDVSDERFKRLQGLAQWVEPELNAILELAEGRMDGVVDTTGKPWDHAPLVVIVKEAGGKYSDISDGESVALGEGRFSNKLIHGELVDALAI